MYQLNFPLLEKNDYQGFTWEKEWRLPSSEGLEFNLNLVKIVCCPNSEQEEIVNQLGVSSEGIQFINHWEEYNEVVDFLKRRKTHLQLSGLNNFENGTNVEELKKLASKTSVTLNGLKKYLEMTIKLSSEAQDEAECFIQEFDKKFEKLVQRISKLEEME